MVIELKVIIDASNAYTLQEIADAVESACNNHHMVGTVAVEILRATAGSSLLPEDEVALADAGYSSLPGAAEDARTSEQHARQLARPRVRITRKDSVVAKGDVVFLYINHGEYSSKATVKKIQRSRRRGSYGDLNKLYIVGESFGYWVDASEPNATNELMWLERLPTEDEVALTLAEAYPRPRCPYIYEGITRNGANIQCTLRTGHACAHHYDPAYDTA
jgi:hypothetical protein